MAKNKKEQLITLDQKIAELKAKKQHIEKQAKEEERKKRTRELIQIGAIINSIGIETIKQAEALKNNLNKSPDMLTWVKTNIEPEIEPEIIESKESAAINSTT